MYVSKVNKKLKLLSNEQLISLVKELKQTTIPADSILREVIKDTELDTTAPLLAFIEVGQMLAHVLADRLELALRNK